MLAMFPSMPDHSIEIHLDDTARNLNTERRRIYDIVNVFEAVQIMSKVIYLIEIQEIISIPNAGIHVSRLVRTFISGTAGTTCSAPWPGCANWPAS